MNDAFVGACESARASLISILPAIRQIIVSAQEENSAKALPGLTADENQKETADQAELALRDAESAIMRLGKAEHAYLGDDTTFAPGVAANTAAPADAERQDQDSTDTSSDGAGDAGESSGDASGESAGDGGGE